MEQQGVQLDRETFSCSICLDLLKDPVAIPCGHSYCMSCITNFWDEGEQKRSYYCPQCRQTFTERPVLQKNTMLAALMDQLKKTGLQAAPVDHCYAGPEDVACDVCTGRKLKAVKSCLACPASYCEQHLQPHYNSIPLKKHKLVEPSKNLQENICSKHGELMKMFCQTDRKCICYLCPADDHKGHNTVSAAVERTEREKELQGRRNIIQQMIQGKDADVKLLQRESEAINRSADKTVKDCEKIFTELIHLLHKRSSDVKQQIRSQQETEVSRVKDLQEKLEQEITELKRKDAELEQLSNTVDHTQFLHSYPSLSALSETRHVSIIKVRPLRHFEEVTEAVTKLGDKLKDILKDSWTNISLLVTDVNVLLSEPELEPKSRDGFLKYSCQIILDPNTENDNLLLSEGNRKVTGTAHNQSQPSYQQYPNQQYSNQRYPNQVHPNQTDTFTGWCQFVSRESLNDRCYWEVEWSGQQVYVAVSYKNIKRVGSGNSGNSWALECSQNSFAFVDNGRRTLSGPVSSRVGVYLDRGAGLLFFYSVSETMTLLQRVQTRFTEPLHAGVYVCNTGGSAKFFKPK